MLKEVKMKTLTINYSQHIHNIVFNATRIHVGDNLQDPNHLFNFPALVPKMTALPHV